jgi:Flp pilus assembly protein TadD
MAGGLALYLGLRATAVTTWAASDPTLSLFNPAATVPAMQRGRPAEALDSYRRARRSDPANTAAIYGMAVASLALGDREGARTYAGEAAAAGAQIPEDFWRRWHLHGASRVSQRQGDPDEICQSPTPFWVS